MKLTIGDQEYDVQPGADSISVGEASYSLRVVRRGNILTVYVNEKPFAVQLPESLPEEGPVKLLVVECTGAGDMHAIARHGEMVRGVVTTQRDRADRGRVVCHHA